MKRILSCLLVLAAELTFGRYICQPQGVVVEDGEVAVSQAVSEVLADDFSRDRGLWSLVNFENRLKIERKRFLGRDALVVSNGDKERHDTAFEIKSRQISVRKPRFFIVTFDCATDLNMASAAGHKELYWNGVLCYDRWGTLLSREQFRYRGSKGAYQPVRVTGRFPEGTCSFALSFGSDTPNVRHGNYVAYANVKVKVWQEEAPGGKRGEGSFTSRPLRYSKGGFWGLGADKLSWDLCGRYATARFQLATAKDIGGAPGVFSAFKGPDGRENSWFEEDGAALPEWVTSAEWVRYRCELRANGGSQASLEEVCIGGACDEDWERFFDCDVPEIKRISPSPEANCTRPVAVRLTDAFGIDRSSLQVLADGKDVSKDVIQTAQGFTYVPKQGFTAGIHRLEVSVRDQNGFPNREKLFFRVGQGLKTGKVTLRDDGMVLIDGKPFFPIGVYAVTEIERSGFNYDQAFAELKSVGVNFVHTYGTGRTPKFRRFMDMAAKHGMKIWVAGHGGSNDADLERIVWSLEMDMDNPAILAWYIGDDTASHNLAEQLGQRTELVKAIAPQMITVHADTMGQQRDRYREFAPMSLAFLPEIYPVREGGQKDAETCVPNVILDMERCFADVREQGLAPRTIWPIIQYFKGWSSWKRFPTNRELRAMSYAAIVSGAQGITWYTYNTNPKTKNRGVTATPETWKNFSTLTKELAGLSPVLVERAAEYQLAPTILEGPAMNALGGPSVIALTKIHRGKTYLLTVNSALKPVKVSFELPQKMSGRRLYEEGTVTIEGTALKESYGPYDVKLFELWRLP